MTNPVKTIGAILAKQSVVFISSVDENGMPNTKAMLAPRKREGIRVILFSYQHILYAGTAIQKESKSLPLFL